MIVIRTLCILMSITVFPLEAKWVRRNHGLPVKFSSEHTALFRGRGEQRALYFANGSNLYLYDEKSKEWKPLLKLSNGEFVLQLVEAKKRRLYLLSERALYLFDQGKLTVIHMRSGNELLRSFVWDAQTQDFYLASNRKLYRSLFPYNTWTHLMTAPRQLTQLCLARKNLFALNREGLWIASDHGESWQQVWSTVQGRDDQESLAVETESLHKELIIEERLGALRGVQNERLRYFPHNHSLALLYGEEMVIWNLGIRNFLKKKWTSQGLPERVVYDFCESEDLWITSAKGVFRYDLTIKSWKQMYEGLELVDIPLIVGGDRPFLGTRSALYEWQVPIEGGDHQSLKKWMGYFSREPSIQAVHERSIEYADVSQRKIEQMRVQARKQALWPVISTSYKKGMDDSFNVYSNGLVVDRPIERDREWGLSLSWNLGDMVFSSSQIAIDVRSRLMVQLREEILNDVTRIYFERRREQLQAKINPLPKSTEVLLQALRISELTALLDTYTNGWFSEELIKIE